MNSDRALDEAARSIGEIEVIFSDLKTQGVVDFVVAGSHVSGDPNDAIPTVVIHLKVDGADFRSYHTQIVERTAEVRAKGISITIFPKRPRLAERGVIARPPMGDVQETERPVIDLPPMGEDRIRLQTGLRKGVSEGNGFRKGFHP